MVLVLPLNSISFSLFANIFVTVSGMPTLHIHASLFFSFVANVDIFPVSHFRLISLSDPLYFLIHKDLFFWPRLDKMFEIHNPSEICMFLIL